MSSVHSTWFTSFEASYTQKQSAALTFIRWTVNICLLSLSWFASGVTRFNDLLSEVTFRADCDISLTKECKMFNNKLPYLLSLPGLVLSFGGSRPEIYTRQSTNSTTPLVNFQVSQPPITPKIGKTCTVQLFRRTFANSYYRPEIVEYEHAKYFLVAPNECGDIGKWAGISLNWTATSQGRQYDRLAGNVEIWRTSTAEPTTAGIIWTQLKDVTKYIPLFSRPGRMIVDLNNIVDESLGLNGEYDGEYRIGQTAFTEPKHAPKSDLVIPLSNLSPDQANYAAVPPTLNNTVKFPRNAAKAFVEVFASGNSAEEFWYFNLADSWVSKLPSGTTYGKGAYREVRLLVDGKLAGVVNPYPVIFTGGFIPTMWRPISAYGSFDQPTYSIDLTPFIPLLSDGANHTISIDVVAGKAASADHSINGNWYVSGNIQVFLDSSSEPTTGKITSYTAPGYSTSDVKGIAASNDVNVTETASRTLHIEAEVKTGSGKTTKVVWSQDLNFKNVQSYLNNATRQIVDQVSSGKSISTHNGIPIISDDYNYPLNIDFLLVAENNASGWNTILDHSFNRKRLSTGSFLTAPNGTRVVANGTAIQDFSYRDAKLNTYQRHVEARNSDVTSDSQNGTLTSTWPWSRSKLPKGASGAHSDYVARLPIARDADIIF
ncbi:peptide-N(4)-(N-acetyl-beta-glucosaminyl)asparagine amidase A [Rhizoctonia solani]|uniref:Peptide-N(4)-(N-acetyl-beta-glucosaminyl)asparagine amidase A n=1 Tax=Rhizoctonia solani TaxID=456999 RepID=A0A8H8NP82_9AGAM|nr:peptide-N(4)-(N-acetyl-beta-glucosaminyl)asparagine amidase A [Rhizoctonia solani]QRW16080.1 peptide-N(4)-(N-acetyl-beta-glucosaminyl)asparagine amidase A [Rhizoctonia solani]